MANIKSAKKRILTAERNRLQNKAYKSAIKTFTKRFQSAVDDYKQNPSDAQLAVVQKEMSTTFSKIDKAVKTGVFHRNTGARKKAGLARLLKAAS
ncbi:30S ribosomal protein S20 [Acaryochloris sp. IP29b_bin.148]|uniref:30S ribosomal protein S20 n=1 Tax=Acaryochloris sp. IP29b_bin.148 TaxID=2969218 RepID=UPI00262CC0F5|nr:30S ribosomal protein S20 [Acaryochloris sp. IP29b_bin.148]